MKTNPTDSPRPTFWVSALLAAALLSAGFVHRNIKNRRSRSGRQKTQLEFQKAKHKKTTRAHRYRSLRSRRRNRGRGWAGSRWDRLTIRHLSFEKKSGVIIATLRPSQIRAVMKHYNQAIAQCLLRHRAAAVSLRLTILSTGRLHTVRTSLAGAADRCVRNAVGSARFPSFKGTRATGRYKVSIK
jgi:hypothetical protein